MPAKVQLKAVRGPRAVPSPYDVVVRLAQQGQPLAALGAVQSARDALEELGRRAAAAALVAGSSWADIGAVLGVSKQAAHKRWATSQEQALEDAREQERQQAEVVDNATMARR